MNVCNLPISNCNCNGSHSYDQPETKKSSCDSPECRHHLMMMQKVTQDPMAAFKGLSAGGRRNEYQPDNSMLLALGNAASNARIKTLQIANFFIQCILEGYVDQGKISPYSSASTAPLWHHPLLGLSNLINGVKPIDQSQEPMIHAAVCRAYLEIIPIVWRDLKLLLPPTADELRSTVCRFIGNFSALNEITPDIHTSMYIYDKSSISLAMHCWTYMTSDRYYRDSSTKLIPVLFAGELAAEGIKAPPDIKIVAVQTVTVESIIAHVLPIIRDENLLDLDLKTELRALFSFATARHPFSRAFATARTHEHVANALMRQIRKGSANYTTDVLHLGHIFLNNMVAIAASDNPMPFFSDIIGSTCVLDIVALRLVAPEREISREWSVFLTKIVYALNTTDPESKYHKTPAFVQAARSACERVYVPTIIGLRRTRIQDDDALRLWTNFGALLGISEDTIFAKWRAERQCGNPTCPLRGNHYVQIKACSSCRDIYYCDRTCQESDWKRHKSLC